MTIHTPPILSKTLIGDVDANTIAVSDGTTITSITDAINSIVGTFSGTGGSLTPVTVGTDGLSNRKLQFARSGNFNFGTPSQWANLGSTSTGFTIVVIVNPNVASSQSAGPFIVQTPSTTAGGLMCAGTDGLDNYPLGGASGPTGAIQSNGSGNLTTYYEFGNTVSSTYHSYFARDARTYSALRDSGTTWTDSNHWNIGGGDQFNLDASFGYSGDFYRFLLYQGQLTQADQNTLQAWIQTNYYATPLSAIDPRISISTGVNSFAYHYGVITNISNAWAPVLQTQLGDKYRFLNEGVPGETFVDADALFTLSAPIVNAFTGSKLVFGMEGQNSLQNTGSASTAYGYVQGFGSTMYGLGYNKIIIPTVFGCWPNTSLASTTQTGPQAALASSYNSMLAADFLPTAVGTVYPLSLMYAWNPASTNTKYADYLIRMDLDTITGDNTKWPNSTYWSNCHPAPTTEARIADIFSGATNYIANFIGTQQLQIKSSGGTYSDVSGATLSPFTVTGLSNGNYVARVAYTVNSNTTYSNEISITISGSAALSAGTTTASVAPNVVTLTTTAATGGAPPYTYQYYVSTTNGFTPGAGNIVTGATFLSSPITGLTGGTQYYGVQVVTDSASNTAASTQVGFFTKPSGTPIVTLSLVAGVMTITRSGTITGATSYTLSRTVAGVTTVITTSMGTTFSDTGYTGALPSSYNVTPVNSTSGNGSTGTGSTIGASNVYVLDSGRVIHILPNLTTGVTVA